MDWPENKRVMEVQSDTAVLVIQMMLAVCCRCRYSNVIMLSNALVWVKLCAEWNAEGGFGPNDGKTRLQLWGRLPNMPTRSTLLCIYATIGTFVHHRGLKTSIQTANICIHFTHKVMSFLDKRSNCASNRVTVPILPSQARSLWMQPAEVCSMRSAASIQTVWLHAVSL